MGKCTICGKFADAHCDKCTETMCKDCDREHCDCFYIKGTKLCKCSKKGKVAVMQCNSCYVYCTDNLNPLSVQNINVKGTVFPVVSGGDCENCLGRYCSDCGISHCQCWFSDDFKKCTCYVPPKPLTQEDDEEYKCESDIESPNEEFFNDDVEEEYCDDEY